MASTKRTRRSWTKDQIRELLTRYRRSGKSKREFCDHEGISYTSFGNWFRKRRAGAKRASRRKKDPFVELLPGVQGSGQPVAKMIFTGGQSLTFFAMPDAALLKTLLREPVVSHERSRVVEP